MRPDGSCDCMECTHKRRMWIELVDGDQFSNRKPFDPEPDYSSYCVSCRSDTCYVDEGLVCCHNMQQKGFCEHEGFVFTEEEDYWGRPSSSGEEESEEEESEEEESEEEQYRYAKTHRRPRPPIHRPSRLAR